MAFDISAIRLQNQQLLQPDGKTATEVVAHFGAMQAQDYAMAKWAIGVRLPEATDSLIEKALDDGAIFRTHILRPTWHFVAAEDIHWMLGLTSANVLRQMNSSNRQLGLDENIFRKSHAIIGKALAGGKHLTRDEIMEILKYSGINTESYRSAHIMFHAELSGLVCNGVRQGKQHTYGLLDERVKRTKHFTKDEALAELAKRYFTSHGPATIRDFTWWSGLSVTDSKKAVAANEKKLVSKEFDGQTYFMAANNDDISPKSVHLLPAFDEFMISYKDRSASIEPGFSKLAFTGNGIFKPIVVVNGQVVGIWKRTPTKDKMRVEVQLFQKITKNWQREITTQAERYADFMEKTAEVIF